ncbi:MAG TPA: SRPBCC domain-containing protein [Polyangiaceae bacterium]
MRLVVEGRETMETTKARATKTLGAFRMDCAIRATIQATPERVWALLTDAAAFPTWNSTVTSIEGRIEDGQKLKLRVPSAPQRVFEPRVSQVKPGRSMIWSDGMAPFFKGVRTFELTPRPDGSTEFAMKEEFSGLMLPMIKGSLPDFAPVFEAYAEDLKRAAEGGAS